MEVDHHEQVHQHDREDNAAEQSGERGLHRRHLTANHDARTGRELLLRTVHDAGNVARHAAEIAALCGAVDIDHGLNVVVRHHGVLCSARQRAERTEYLRLRIRDHAAIRKGNILQRLQR